MAAVVVLGAASFAQAIEVQKGIVSFGLNGYYKNLISVSDTKSVYKDLGLVNKRWFFDDYNRIRIKSRLDIGEHFEAICQYEAFLANGDTMVAQYRTERTIDRIQALFGPLPEDELVSLTSFVYTEATPRFLDMEETRLLSGGQRMSHNIDRLTLHFTSTYVDSKIGRMALSWGTGRIWNPTDMWAPFSPTEIDKDEKRGVDLATVTFFIPKVGNLEGVYAPLSLEDHYEIEADDSSAGGRFRFHIGEYDISLMGGMFGPDAVAGMDFSGYLWNAGFRGEATYTFVDPDDEERDYVQAVLSADYGFAARYNPYLLIEGFFNGMGEPNPDDYLDRMADKSVARKLRMGRSFSLGQKYLAAQTTLQPHPLVTLTLMPILNVDDVSGFVSFATTYSVTDYANLIFGTNHFIGADNTEFGGIRLPSAGLPLANFDTRDLLFKTPDRYYVYLKAYF